MRLTILLSIAAMINVHAAGLSQTITFSVKNRTLQTVFKAVERQTGYVVFGNADLLKDTRRVSLHVSDMPLTDFLKLVLKDQPLNFRLVNQNIMLSRKTLVASKTVPPVSTPSETMVVLIDIAGQVLDQAGEPVQGATITIKGSNKATSASVTGKFNLKGIAGNEVLVVSAIGFTPLTFRLNGAFVILVPSGQEQEGTVSKEPDGSIAVRLVRSVNSIGEVVVTALGIQRQAKSLAYSAQRVAGENLNSSRDANFANTLSGKVAGLVVTQSANGPGGASRIVLRGNRSIQGNNNALIVVDGVAVDNSTPAQVNSDQGGQVGSDGAANINADDIESVNVLKGAAASALYGSRASNGVLLITTKKGKSGRLAIDINSGVSVETPMSLPRFQNEYAQGNGGVYAPAASQNWGPKITGQQVTDWAGKPVSLTAYPDNVKDFFQKAISTNNYIGINGGFEKVQTYFSYANNNAEGLIPNNILKRHTANFRINAKLSPRLSMDAKITYMVQNIFGKPKVGEENAHVINLYKMPRNVNLDDIKNYYTTDATGIESQRYWASTSVYMNPYWTANKTRFDEERNRVIGLASVRYSITDWLNIQGRFTTDRYEDNNSQIFSNNTLIFAQPGGNYSVGHAAVSETNADVLLSGNNTITKDFKITYNIGASILKRSNKSLNTSTRGLQVPNKFDLAYASSLGVVSGNSETELQSVYGTTQLAFKNYLFLDITGRNDWSSTLPAPQSFFYPSVGLTAVLSDMFTMPTWISFGKIRGSYTKVGNDAAPYLLVQNYSFSQGGTAGFISQDATKSIGNLQPELTTSIEGGAELRLLDNRFGIDVTVYKTNSKNQLLRLGLPVASGFSDQYINAGNIQNKGIEIILNAGIVRSSSFKWDAGINFARNVNKVIELSDGIDIAVLGVGNIHSANPIVQVNGAYGDLIAVKWKKLNGEYLVNDAGRPVMSDKMEKIGNFNPNFNLGFTNTLSYKNWECSFLIDGRFGGIMTSGTDGNLAYDGSGDFTTKFRDRSWVLQGVTAGGGKNTKAINAEEFWTTVGGRYTWGELFAYDATNVRLREFQIGYRFKSPLAFIQQAKISLVGRNVFFFYRGSTIVDIPGIGKRKMFFDPDVNLSAGNYQGVEYGSLPSSRSIGINLKLTF